MITAMFRPEALLLFFVLLFSPLAFGTVEPWSHAIAGGAALAGLAAALHHRTRDGRLRLYDVPGALPLLLFLGFMLLQCLPLPPQLLHLLSPAAYRKWDAALGGRGPLPWPTISLDPLATLREFVRFSACAAIYVLIVQLLTRRERLRTATTVLAIFAAVLSFEAILQILIAPHSLLFFRKVPGGTSFGPFVNRNHYANLMAMLTPVVFALFLGIGRRAGGRTLRARLVDLLAGRESNLRLLLGFAALLTAGSLLISLSRGATVAVSAALIVFGICLRSQGLGQRRTTSAAVFFCVLVIFVSWFGWEKVAVRFDSMRTSPIFDDTKRAGPWMETARMSADFPLLGAGIGSFERLYPAYRTRPSRFAIAHAHNDYLELLAGGGVVGFGLLSWFVAAVLVRVVKTCRQRHDRYALFLAYGSLAGCVAFLVHSGFDFSLAIGANALYFFFLLGLAVSAAHTRGLPDDQGSLLEVRRIPAYVSHAVAALAVAAILGNAADLAARHSWHLAKEQVSRADARSAPTADLRKLVERAARLQPLEASFPAALARIASREEDPDEALRLTRRALRLLPIDAGTLMQHATLLAARNEIEPARRSFAAAVAANPTASRPRETFGAWLLSRRDREDGAAQLREAMKLEPARSPRIISLLVLGRFSDEQIAAIVPPEPAALLSFAQYSNSTGGKRLAVETYRQVLSLDPGNLQALAGLKSIEASR